MKTIEKISPRKRARMPCRSRQEELPPYKNIGRVPKELEEQKIKKKIQDD